MDASDKWGGVFALPPVMVRDRSDILSENCHRLPRGDYARRAVSFEIQEVSPVSGHQVVRLAGLRHGAQKIVCGVGTHVHFR